jgi:hypothetical protein
MHLETLDGGGITITNNYGLYQSGTGTKNYFEGDVGIGTNTPARLLNIVDNPGSNPIQSIRNSNTSWGQYALTRYGTEGEDFRYMDFGYYRGSSEPTRGLVIKSQANATLVTFLDSGKVGIGTTDPKSKLDIQGAIAISNGDQDLGTHTHSTYASLVPSGCIKFTAGYSGTLVAGRTFVFKYNAVSWKAYHGTITLASTQGFSKHHFGGYWNSSGGHDVDSFDGANATCAISHSGQAVIVTLTLTAGCTHPMVSVEYHQSGGDGAPRLDRAEMQIN